MASFPETRWSLISASHDAERVRPAMEELFGRYRGPIEDYLRRFHVPGMETEDVVQDFLLHGVEHELFSSADRRKGSFRAFLVTALRQHVGRLLEREQAIKRGGLATHVDIDDQQISASESDAPDQVFDRAFVREVMYRALAALETLAVERGKLAEFLLLKPYISEDPAPGDYESVAKQLGQNRNLIAVTVARLRAKFREFVREELSDTVSSERELDAEIVHLRG